MGQTKYIDWLRCRVREDFIYYVNRLGEAGLGVGMTRFEEAGLLLGRPRDLDLVM